MREPLQAIDQARPRTVETGSLVDDANAPCQHCGERPPSRRTRQQRHGLFALRILAAKRNQNDIRRTCRHVAPIDRRRRRERLAEAADATSKASEFRHPEARSARRVQPLKHRDPRPFGHRHGIGARPHGRNPAAQPGHHPSSLVGLAARRADPGDSLQHVLKGSWWQVDDARPRRQPAQRGFHLAIRRTAVAKPLQDDEVWPHTFKHVHAQRMTHLLATPSSRPSANCRRLGIAIDPSRRHGRQPLNGDGGVALMGHANQPGAQGQAANDLRGAGRERNNAHCRERVSALWRRARLSCPTKTRHSSKAAQPDCSRPRSRRCPPAKPPPSARAPRAHSGVGGSLVSCANSSTWPLGSTISNSFMP